MDPLTTSTSNARLDSVLALGRAMNAARSPVDLAESVAEEILRALPAASVAISRWEPERDVLRTLVNVGDLADWEERRPADETYPAADCEVLRDPANVPAAVYDLADPDCPPFEAEILRRCGKRTSLNAAVLYAGRAWGEIAATRGADDPPFTLADLEYAEAVAGFVALAFAQADHAARVGRLAVEDPLTGLGNRRAADAALDSAFDAHGAGGSPVAVVLCDVNELKRVNDRHGHQAGDALLRHVAGAVAAASALAPGAVATRMGGDEFAVVVPGGVDAARRVAEELCRRVSRRPGDRPVAVGVAATDVPGVGPVDSPLRLLRLADAAQYRAKRTGSSTPVVAGWALPPSEPGALPAGGPGAEEGAAWRAVAPPMPLEVAAAALDELERTPGGAAQRLAALGRSVAIALGAAAWYVSGAGPGETALRTRTGWVLRQDGDGRPSDGPADEDGEWPLADYPVTVRALRGRGFAVHRDELEADPAEVAALAGTGYAAVVGAGATAPDGERWLLEVYVDELGHDVEGLDVVLPGLVAIAVLPRPDDAA